MTIMQQKLFSSGGALDKLAAIDADIANALSRFGPPPDRSLPASFETLARSIIGQQISRAAASAIWTRMRDQDQSSAPIIAAKQPDDLMPFGLSRRKAEYLIGIADEIQSGRLDLAALAEMSGEDVQKRLVEIRGIGAWTADNFRLFALGDVDAWPAMVSHFQPWSGIASHGWPLLGNAGQYQPKPANAPPSHTQASQFLVSR